MGVDSVKKNIYKILAKRYHRFLDMTSANKIKKHLKNIEKTEKNSVIKVAFLVQMPEVWDKQQPVYEAMVADERYQVSLLLVPEFDFENSVLGKYGKVKDFFTDKYPDADIVYASDDAGIIIDLEKYKFDYIFYERPYSPYLPDELRSANVCRFLKVCYIPYTTPDFAEGDTVAYKDFYRNVYIGFMNSEIRTKRLEKSFTKRSLSCHKFVNIGYPVLDECRKLEEIPHDKTTVMWAPRWSFSDDIGGSHFLDYKDDIVEFANRHNDIQILQRPHPLMFSNILKCNIMTEEQVDTYKNKCSANGIKFDTNKVIEDSFKETDILISDLSSILWLFFYTGKPIIYCPCDIELSEELTELIQYMYVAKSWEEVSKILEQLLQGNDIMKKEREKFLLERKNKYNDATENILEFIYKDYIA